MMWGLRAATARFLEIESELGALGRPIGGVPAWERVRVTLHQALLLRLGVFKDPPPVLQPGGSARASRAMGAARSVAFRNPFAAPTADVMVFAHSRRQRGADGRWHDIYTDPLIESLERSSVSFESRHMGAHAEPAATRSLRHLDAISVLGRLAPAPKLPREDAIWVSEAERRWREEFSVDLPIAAVIRQDLGRRTAELPLYQRLVRRVKPKVALLVCGYGKETIIEALHAEGVPVAELQHGTIHDAHLGYHFPSGTKSAFPDALFTFGEFWNAAAAYPIQADRVRSVGFAHLEAAIGERASRSAHHVLFLSQRSIGQELSRFAAAFAEKSDLPVVYRLHPSELPSWRQDYPWLAAARLDVSTGDAALYDSIASARAVVGVYSTALAEAAAFGKPVFVVRSEGHEALLRMASEGWAEVVSSPAELADALREAALRARPESSHIFRPHAVRNVRDELARLA